MKQLNSSKLIIIIFILLQNNYVYPSQAAKKLDDIDINFRDAILHTNIKQVRNLIKTVDINKADKYGNTPLKWAISNAAELRQMMADPQIHKLTKAGIKPDYKNALEIINLLLSNKADQQGLDKFIESDKWNKKVFKAALNLKKK